MPARAALRQACLAELSRRGWRTGFEEPIRSLYAQRVAARRPAELKRLYRISCASYVVLFTLFNLPLFSFQELPLVLGLLSIGPIFWLIAEFILAPSRPAWLREAWALGSASFIVLASTQSPLIDPPIAALCGFFLASVPVIWVLVFLRLRLRDNIIFTVLSLSFLGIAITERPDIDLSLRLYPLLFMAATALPTLASSVRIERASRRLYLHGLLQRMQINDMAAQNSRLETLSLTDPLTGIANRRRLDEALAEPAAGPRFLLLIDVDHFKKFNDDLGHLAGDAALRRIARLIAAQLSDADVLARFGGEEFAVLTHRVDMAAAFALAERIRGAVAANPLATAQGPRHLTVSIGLAQEIAQASGEALIGRADSALYAAKHAGRDCIRVAVGNI